MLPNGSETAPSSGDDALDRLRTLRDKMVEEGVVRLVPQPGPIESFIINAPEERLRDILKSFCRRYGIKYTGGDYREWLLYYSKIIDEDERKRGEEVTDYHEIGIVQQDISEEVALSELERQDREQHEFREAHANDNTTDYGNADRFLNHYGLDVKYCAPFDQWYIWNEGEGRWKRDQMGEIQELAKKTVMHILREAERRGFGSEQGKSLTKWALQCQTPSHTQAILKLACSDPWVATPPDAFDSEKMLLNMKNGVFDLENQKLLPHTKQRLISQSTNIVFDDTAECPLWLAFLDRIFRSNPHKSEIISFLRRAIGYTLTGQTHEQVLFLLYGRGANGKSVFLNTIDAMLGEYALTANSATFTTAKSDKVRNDVAAFVGKRFVKSAEITKSATLDEELVKSLTGEKKIRSRFLYKEEFEFTPTMKLWLAFNHRPDIRDRTTSIWRRILLVPFEEVIPDYEQDKFLQDKLERELPGIFNWVVEGLKDWRSGGLLPPACVLSATEEYRKDTDILFDFIDEVCIVRNDVSEYASELYGAYRQWCSFNHYLDKNIMSSTKFGKELKERFAYDRTKRGILYLGISTNPEMIAKIHKNY